MFNYLEFNRVCYDKSVLLVEDDRSLLLETKDVLEDIFSHIDTASNGEEGLKKFTEYYKNNSTFYDIVCSDISMPKMNGIEFTKAMYQQNPKQNVIIFSAYTNKEYLIEFINIGVDSFVSKPVNYKNLMQSLKKSCLSIKKENKQNNSLNKLDLNDGFIWEYDISELTHDGNTVKLTKNEVCFLNLILSNPKKIYSYDEIIHSVWKDLDAELMSEINIKHLVSRIRRKLPKNSIINMYGQGYQYTD